MNKGTFYIAVLIICAVVTSIVHNTLSTEHNREESEYNAAKHGYHYE